MGKSISLLLGDLYYLETMLIRMSEAKNASNKEVFKNIALLWLLKVYEDDEYVDRSNWGTIQGIMMELCEKLSGETLKILETVGADDTVIGSPFSDPQGKGMQKYMDFLFKINEKKQTPKWYPALINR